MANKKFYYKPKKPQQPAVDNSAITAKYSSEQLNLPVGELGLSEELVALLVKNGVHKAQDLIVRTEKDMYRIQGFNKKFLFQVKDGLKAHSMSLREDTKPQAEAQNKPKPQPQQKKQQNPAPQRPSYDDKRGKFVTDNDKKKAPAVRLTAPLKLEDWRKVMKGGKWGYSDGMKVVIQPMYDEVFCFKEGLASVELDGKCGYIDSENNVVIPFEYDTAMSFSEGLAMVEKNNKCGYINKNNEVVFDFQYDAAAPFEGGEAKVKKDGRWATLTKDGQLTYI